MRVNINPFIDLLSTIISLYNFAVFLWIIIFWLLHFNVINAYHPVVKLVYSFLGRIIDPVLDYMRRFIPPIAGIDISVLVLILLLQFLENVLYTYFYQF